MTTRGRVRTWSDAEGWGVVDSRETPTGCWAHFSHVKVVGYAALTPGQEVELEWEVAEQDGYHFRATAVWPAGADPVETPVVTGPTSAYSSTLTITFDDGDQVHPAWPPSVD